MVVADDHAISESLAGVLAGEGFEVLTASDTSEALALSEGRHPAAVIVDSQIGHGTGAELARQLKDHSGTSSVLLLTNPGVLDSVLPVASGLDGLLVKPLVPQLFVQTVRNSLTQMSLREENLRLADELARVSADIATLQARAASIPEREAEAAPVTSPTEAAPAHEPPLAAESGRDGEAGQGAEAGHDVESHLGSIAAKPRRPSEPPSRSYFADRLGTALAQSQASGNPMAVVVVELRGWPAAVTELGDDESEGAISELASDLSARRRRTDLVGRTALDRFAVACSDIRSPSDCHRVVKIVLDALEGPVEHDGKEHWLAPRAGAVITDPSSPTQSADMVLADAEMALTCALDEGRVWMLFDKSMLDQAIERQELGLGVGIREALDNDELTLVYHPLTELQSGRVVGAALRIRWMRPGDPILLSSELLAQEGDFVLSAKVGAWMLETAFADISNWRKAHQLDDLFSVALGISARDATDPQFAETAEELMSKYDIPPSMVQFDLSVPAARQAATPAFALRHLGELGVRFNLDDFGGEEMDLSWLMEVPVRSLKISTSLVDSLDSQEDSRATPLVRGLIALAHEIRLNVVGKGVRTSAQRMALLAMGCELAQYARFGRPGDSGEPWAPAEDEA